MGLYSCDQCDRKFRGGFFDIIRNIARVHYKSPVLFDEVEIGASDQLAVFCSKVCMDEGRAEVMAKERVRVPATPPDINPIESCAVCRGPVSMSNWHVS